MLRSTALTSLLCVLAFTLCAPRAWADQDEPAAAAAETVVETETLVEAAAEPELDLAAKLETLLAQINWFWTCVAAFLVFFMQSGFALVEAGLTRAKNVVNIMMKNLMDFAIGSILFWAVGFGLMFSATNGLFGTGEFFPNPDALAGDSTGLNIYGKQPNEMYTFLMFQTVFAATAATIVSGAMAERTKFVSYLVYSAAITAVIYPISGSWAWGGLWNGGGWLEAPEGGLLAKAGLPGLVDFAGSSVVHLCGGVAGLAGAIALGPRKGKYNPDGTSNAIPGHNLALVTLGGLILWLGWFGFNAGSTTSIEGGDFARIAVVTNVAAAAGALGAMFTAWGLFGKPEISMTINGALAGLVGITAGCATMTIWGGLITGLLAGVLVVFSVLAFDRLKIDDPVGAISVHGVCGAFGTLMCGVPFVCRPGEAGSLVTQAIGVSAIALYTFVATFVLFMIIKVTIGLRVSEEEEIQGLDMLEHGVAGYNP